MKLYVGNLPYSVDDQKLQKTFEAYGQVTSATVIMNNLSGKSKGFGFVEMPNNDEANNAIESLNESSLGGRNIRVNEARPRAPRDSR